MAAAVEKPEEGKSKKSKANAEKAVVVPVET